MQAKDASPCRGFLAPSQLAGADPKTPVLLALSGGMDSRVLLELLANASQKEDFPLLLVHVNHGIRGEEALRDKAFCRGLAEQYGLEIVCFDVDIPALAAAHRRGLEEEARRVRYRLFAELMRERKIPLLATAHHADDNAETVLFRLSRGCGLKGLCGISPVRPFGDGFLVRPLLRCTRREIADYCRTHALEYVTDSTNTDHAYARNRLRMEVLPILESLFEGVASRVSDMSASLAADEAYLSGVASDFLKAHRNDGRLEAAALLPLAAPIRSRVLQMWVREETAQEVERVHLKDLEMLLQTRASQMRVALPGGYTAALESGFLCLLSDAAETEPFSLPVRLGETLLPSGARITVTEEKPDRKIHNLYTESGIISFRVFDIIEKDCYWRSPHAGDRILSGGMHRRVCKGFAAAGIPARRRAEMPLLCDKEGILWAPFVGRRDGLPTAGHAYTVTLALPQTRMQNHQEKDNDSHV